MRKIYKKPLLKINVFCMARDVISTSNELEVDYKKSSQTDEDDTGFSIN